MRKELSAEERQSIVAMVGASIRDWWQNVPENSGICVLLWDVDDSGKVLYMTNSTEQEDMLSAVEGWLSRMRQAQAMERRAQHIHETGEEPSDDHPAL